MQIEQHGVIPQTVPYSEQRNWKQQKKQQKKKQQKKKQQNLKNGKVRFRLNIDVRKEMEDPRLYAINQLITFVKGRLNFSCKSATAAYVDLTESLLDNWLKNNHITVEKIYYLEFAVCLYHFFTNFGFQILFLNCRKPAEKQNPVATHSN